MKDVSYTDDSFHCYTSDPSLLIQHPPSLPVFLHVSVVDIDQLKLIMMLVGTPGPELLMKISSESVSFEHRPIQFCCAAPLACVCVASALPWHELAGLLLFSHCTFLSSKNAFF